MIRRLGPRVAVLVLVATAAALIPVINPDATLARQLNELAAYALALIGMNIAMGYGGMLTLGTGALIGLGSYASGLIAIHTGVPVPLAIVAGTLVATALGMALLSPALRLGRIAYAMVSLFMAAEFADLLNLTILQPLTNGTAGIAPAALITSSSVNGDDVAQYQYVFWITLTVATVVFLLAWRLTSSHWGRALMAVRNDEVAAASMGIGTQRTRLVGLFCAALCASLAGALLIHTGSSSSLCQDTCPFNLGAGVQSTLILSIFLFSALVVGGAGRRLGPVIGVATLGIFFVLIQGQALSQNPGFAEQLLHGDFVYGALLVAAAVLLPGGLAGALQKLTDRLRPSRREATEVAQEPTALPELNGMTLEVSEVSVAFGGNLALQKVSITCSPGEVRALVGANGSGKTTLLNVISGVLPLSSGSVRGDNAALPQSTHRRARRGIARTFQTPRVAIELSTTENVLSGAFSRYRSGWIGLFPLFWKYEQEDDALRREAMQLLGNLGLGHRLNTPASALTHGERRLLEVARALLMHPRLLLLDEPAAGLAAEELEHLARAISAAQTVGCTVLLVEHNLGFVRQVATSVTVVDRGRIIAEGSATEALGHPEVVAAFVGVTR